jgi:hypothetical protein
MTQIEQIIAEIERLKEIGCPLQKGSDYQHGYDEFYNQIKRFITSLPVEQPSEEFEGLEHSIIEYLGHVPENEPDHSETLYTYEQMHEIARHFANWQKERVIEKAYDWLNDNFFQYGEDGTDNNGCSILYDFKHAMEDEQ